MSNRLEKPIPRRDFLGLAALGTFFAALGAAFIGMLRLPHPSVLPEPSRRYKVGAPAAFPAGEGKTPPGKNVIIIRSDKGLCAISAVCTHLGCIVKKTEEGFDCPCHGSRFDPQGKVLGGPAPRPLDWFALSISPDGQLIVDEGRVVKAGMYLQV